MLSDGRHAGEWRQQATPAIRARVPLEVLRATIHRCLNVSDIYAAVLKALRREIAAAREAFGAGSG